jgi:hypothetical protein
MHRLGSSVVIAAVFATSAALAEDIEVTGSLPVAVSPAKQTDIKTSIARSERGLRQGEQLPRYRGEFTSGMTVPVSVDLIALAQDAITEIPTTSSYRFVLMSDGIAVVDPASRIVIQVIK